MAHEFKTTASISFGFGTSEMIITDLHIDEGYDLSVY
jgi:hypothetical protein